MSRKSEGQRPLDFNAPPRATSTTEPTAIPASNLQPPKPFGDLFTAVVENKRRATPEQIEAANMQTFFNYLKNLKIKKEDLKGMHILDVGASGGGFGDIAARFGARVVSIDHARPAGLSDVLEGDSRKLFNLPAERMNLADRLGITDEPKFDLIISNYSTPYVFVNDEQDRRGNWKTKKTPLEWRLEMSTRIHSSFENIFKHLKTGGKAILYPLFLNLDHDEQISVDFGNGEKRDVREFNGVIHEILKYLVSEHGQELDLRLEPVLQENGTNFTRLVMYRKDVK